MMGITLGVLLMPVIQQSAPWMVNGILDGVKERVTFPMLEQRMNVIRGAARHMRCPPSYADQPIIAQILEWNARIAHEHESNRVHWTLLDVLSTDEWNRIPLIEIPCGEMAGVP